MPMNRRLFRCQLKFAAAATLPVLLLGCGRSPCNPATDNLKCDGKQVLVCACTNPFAKDPLGGPLCHSDGFTWIDGPLCSVACDAKIAPSTGCIASTQPVPECNGMELTCWNGNISVCSQGFPLPTTPCAVGKQCTLVPGCQALCLPPSPTPGPPCPQAAGRNDVCLNNVAVFCSCGFLVGSQDCGSVACHTAAINDFGVQGTAALCGFLP